MSKYELDSPHRGIDVCKGNNVNEGNSGEGSKSREVKDMAPCRPEGIVVEVDQDTKEGVCFCFLNPNGCLVNSKNQRVGRK